MKSLRIITANLIMITIIIYMLYRIALKHLILTAIVILTIYGVLQTFFYKSWFSIYDVRELFLTLDKDIKSSIISSITSIILFLFGVYFATEQWKKHKLIEMKANIGSTLHASLLNVTSIISEAKYYAENFLTAHEAIINKDDRIAKDASNFILYYNVKHNENLHKMNTLFAEYSRYKILIMSYLMFTGLKDRLDKIGEAIHNSRMSMTTLSSEKLDFTKVQIYSFITAISCDDLRDIIKTLDYSFKVINMNVGDVSDYLSRGLKGFPFGEFILMLKNYRAVLNNMIKRKEGKVLDYEDIIHIYKQLY